MKNIPETPEKLLILYRESLSALYSEKEITGLLRILFRHLRGWNAAELHLRMADPLADDVPFLLDVLEQLARGKPIQYIIGVSGFRDLELRVSEAVLIPRPETEELVDLVIRENLQKKLQRFAVLDIGTGSGCIALSLSRAFPFADIDGLDLSAEALEVAGWNAAQLQCPVRFLHLDILDPSARQSLSGYDLIVSNPPYVTESEKRAMHGNVLEYEPPAALFVPDGDPMKYYKAIAVFAWEHLIRPGTLYVEINEHFGREVSALFASCGLEKVTIHKDLNGKDRFVSASARSLMKDTSYWMVDKEQPDLT
jgi:release factor glutamine methyltransferase